MPGWQFTCCMVLVPALLSSGLCMQVCHGIAQTPWLLYHHWSGGCLRVARALLRAAQAREKGIRRAAVGFDVWLGGLVARPSTGHWGTGRWRARGVLR